MKTLVIIYTKAEPLGDGTEVVSRLDAYPSRRGKVKIDRDVLDLLMREAGYEVREVRR